MLKASRDAEGTEGERGETENPTVTPGRWLNPPAPTTAVRESAVDGRSWLGRGP